MLRFAALGLLAALLGSASAEGAFPGKNGRVAYVESARGRASSGWGPTIVSIRLDGSGRQTLTTATRTSGDFEPAWSPDGRRLAYVHSTGRQLGTGTAARRGAPTDAVCCSCAAGSSSVAVSDRAPISG